MTTAYAAGVQYGPGAQVTSGGQTYMQSSEEAVEGVAPPAAPWIQTGVASGAQSVHIANAVADGALTSAAPAALNSTQNAATAATDLTTSEALANALKASYNALQADVATSRTERAAVQTDLATLRTALNALVSVVNTLLADLQAAGLMAAS